MQTINTINENDKRYFITLEPFYYGKRLKAYIKVIKDTKDNNTIYTAILYGYNKEVIKQKTFFNISLSGNYIEQNKLYNKCHEYVMQYLNTCKY